MGSLQPHIPVMLDEVVASISPKDGEIYVDGTFGAGGYSRAILEAADCKVYAIDRDPTVQVFADELKKEFPGRIELILGNFSDMDKLLAGKGVSRVDGVVLDVGVSSMQIDQPERGFSFMNDGPLDMRMSGQGQDASWLVNHGQEEEIADIIYQYGGERKSRYVARAIVNAREEEPILTTKHLAEIIRSVVRKSKDKIDPATRTFQALRIWVNDELGELTKALESAEKILLPEGRLVVVSFHSLEDSIVKSFINDRIGKSEGVSRHMPLPVEENKSKTFKLISRKVSKPLESEIKNNIRSRSARLRAAIKIADGEVGS